MTDLRAPRLDSISSRSHSSSRSLAHAETRKASFTLPVHPLDISSWRESTLRYVHPRLIDPASTTKVKDTETGRISVAHFYRECEVWPRLDPIATLQSAPRPIQVTASKSLFLGGPGTVRLTVMLHRLYWVSGQRCFVKALVSNSTTKTLKSFTLTLIRRTTIFKSSAAMTIDGRDDPDACQTNTSYKEVVQSTLETTHRVMRGYAGSKGWWTGVNPGEKTAFSHCVLIPVSSAGTSLLSTPDNPLSRQPDALSIPRGRILEVEYNIRATISAGPLSSDVVVDIPIRVVNFMSLDIPPSFLDPDAAAGATSLRARYHAPPETRNYSTDEQLDGESFTLSGWASGSSDPATSSSLTGVTEDRLDSDAEVDMVVRKASSQHPKAAAEFVSTDNSRSLSKGGPPTIQPLVHSQSRVRSKTTSSIPQTPSSFVKLAQGKLRRMESDSSSTITRRSPPTTPGSHHDIANLTPSSSLTASRQPLLHPSVSQPSSDYTPEKPTAGQVPSPPGRANSAPIGHGDPLERGTRPNAWRSQSDTVAGLSPTKAGSDKASGVRKRIYELEAKMRGNAM